MADFYSLPVLVSSFDVGPTRKLRISMILKLLQEAASRQLEEEDLDYAFLRTHGCVFLLIKATMHILRLPSAGEEIRLKTWFHGLKGAQFVRQMRMTDEHGDTLVECESLWIIADPDSHRILRPKAMPYFDKMPPYEGDAVFVQELPLPKEALCAGETAVRPVRRSDIDCNGHMNNAVYADLLFDYFPGDPEEEQVSTITIQFQGEALRGDEITIVSKKTEGGAVFTARIGEKRCFEACARLKDTLQAEDNAVK